MMRMRPSTVLRLPRDCGDSPRRLRRPEAMAAAGAASVITTDTASGARARPTSRSRPRQIHVSHALPNIERLYSVRCPSRRG